MPLIRNRAPGRDPAHSAAGKPAADLASSEADARWAAARGLTAEADIPKLSQALAREPDARVREAILTSLARIATPQSAEAVTPCLRSDDAGMRTAALDALRAMPNAAAAHLPLLLRDPEADVRLLACELARNLPGPDATPLMTEFLDREADANVCAAAIDVLAEIGGRDALPALARAAGRFVDTPFLSYSIKRAAERIDSGFGSS